MRPVPGRRDAQKEPPTLDTQSDAADVCNPQRETVFQSNKGSAPSPKKTVNIRSHTFTEPGIFAAPDCHPPQPIPQPPAQDSKSHRGPIRNASETPEGSFPSLFSFELAFFSNVEGRLSDAQQMALNKLLIAHFPERRNEILSPPAIRKRLEQSPFALLGHRTIIKDQDGREYEFYHRDLLACVRDLVARPHLATNLSLTPEINIRSCREGLERVFSDLKSADAWAEAQRLLKEGHLLIPLVLSSDKSLV
uniref:Uncharacterized protein n=1 Tax=Romanomermis culicivorax TaxID=13658 RepID=A0A915J5Z9_ROMCU